MTRIERGVLGELSKIQEELDELKDAELQGIKVMQLVEASDMVGALVRWLERHHPGTTLDDLIAMHKVTRRAFESGARQEKVVPAAPPLELPKLSVDELMRAKEAEERFKDFVHPADRICGSGCYYDRGHSGRCSDDPAHP